MLMEKKWNTASNMTSISSMTDLIGAKRKRPTSASGYVIVSHTDEEGINRLANYGKYFFTLDSSSNYDNITKDSVTTLTKTKALVPWTYDVPYMIPKYTKFFSSSGIQFIATDNVTIQTLKDPYSSIKNISSKWEAFLQTGGWNGLKYLKVPIIQGIQKRVDFGFSKVERFESFTINATNVENASNQISKEFFKVLVTLDNGTVEEWVETPNLRLTGAYDKVYETKLLPDNSGVLIKFGDGITGQMLPENALISCEYLESLGSSGNIDFKYQITKMVLPDGQTLVDPRTNQINNFLSCTNINAVSGGTDLQTEDEFKLYAPSSYLQSYAISTIDNYETAISNNSPLSLAKLKCFSTSNVVSSPIVDTSVESQQIINEYSSIKNAIGITGILSSGDKIEDPENSFIIPITKMLSKQKGPNDFFQYVEPNFIQFAVGAICKVADLNISDSQVSSDLSLDLLSKYSVFSTDFKEPLYSSEINKLISTQPYIISNNVVVETLADVSFETEDILIVYNNTTNTITEDTLVAIPFQFDKIFASNIFNAGFHNYKTNSSYLLKAEVKFILNQTQAQKNRTFFMYDNRVAINNEIKTLQESKNLSIDYTKEAPILIQTIRQQNDLLPQIDFFDETTNGYDNRQVRIAQFPYNTSITDDIFMQHAKKYSTTPYEIRPYDIDTETGENKIYEVSQVLEVDRVAISGDESAISGALCYKRNNSYYKNIDIIFEENYDTPDAINYAKGYLLLPMSYLDFVNGISIAEQLNDLYIYEAVSVLLKNNIEIKVMAKPIATDFEPTQENDILFIDESDIKIEKILVTE